ncbi:hypothetical protein BDV95DRAFT_602664 [Massariosphaeria phaeospora]|uniref:Uncharacterized protein n=1 Tax=Massariosphaeria phaeospora TaxID=100035 RepID=A0A7C8MF61_9PLEO|nr:hypothetical protein BDV95DRAFT_602664 [Massariosphaeria phaeospora]
MDELQSVVLGALQDQPFPADHHAKELENTSQDGHREGFGPLLRPVTMGSAFNNPPFELFKAAWLDEGARDTYTNLQKLSFDNFHPIAIDAVVNYWYTRQRNVPLVWQIKHGTYRHRIADGSQSMSMQDLSNDAVFWVIHDMGGLADHFGDETLKEIMAFEFRNKLRTLTDEDLLLMANDFYGYHYVYKLFRQLLAYEIHNRDLGNIPKARLPQDKRLLFVDDFLKIATAVQQVAKKKAKAQNGLAT